LIDQPRERGDESIRNPTIPEAGVRRIGEKQADTLMFVLMIFIINPIRSERRARRLREFPGFPGSIFAR
jgi:hypothetical protein